MNVFRIQNNELVQAKLVEDIPATLVIVSGLTSVIRCTTTIEVDAVTIGTEPLTTAQKNVCYGVLKAGCVVYLAGTYQPSLGNAVRTMVVTGEATAPTFAQMDAMESDGIFRILVSNVAHTEQSVTPTEAQKSRNVIVTADTIPSTVLDEMTGFVAGTICVEYKGDCALPMNNISVAKVIDADEITYKTTTELNALFHANKVAFYNVNGVPCIFATPTGATYGTTTPALWFDITARQTADYVAEQVMTRLRADYPRSKRDKETLTSIKGTTEAVLESLADRRIIDGRDSIDVQVTTDPTDVYGIKVAYVCDIITPLYTVTIVQSVTLGDTSTQLVG